MQNKGKADRFALAVELITKIKDVGIIAYGNKVVVI